MLPVENSIVKFMNNLLEEKKISAEKAEANIKTAQEKQKKYYKKRKLVPGKMPVKFAVGQKVLLYNARKRTRQGDPLSKSWSGPHVIREVIGNKHVRLDNNKVKRNVNHLKPWIFPDSDEEKTTEESANECKQDDVGSSAKKVEETVDSSTKSANETQIKRGKSMEESIDAGNERSEKIRSKPNDVNGPQAKISKKAKIGDTNENVEETFQRSSIKQENEDVIAGESNAESKDESFEGERDDVTEESAAKEKVTEEEDMETDYKLEDGAGTSTKEQELGEKSGESEAEEGAMGNNWKEVINGLFRERNQEQTEDSGESEEDEEKIDEQAQGEDLIQGSSSSDKKNKEAKNYDPDPNKVTKNPNVSTDGKADDNNEDAAVPYGEQEVLNETATTSFVTKLKCIVIEDDSPDVNFMPSAVPEKFSLNANQGKCIIWHSNIVTAPAALELGR